ncbi:MAG TPA: MBL fold metallo-hydrolase [Gaiellaceae bacterium]|jgi:hydroxyacylglutathione hydrolase|nr:MBL fold metallo-hydrolase [Gaiellaceae bacterium]
MSLDVTQLELGPFAVNCYVVRAAGGNEGVVVDPGWPGAWTDIESALGDSRCAAILITHGDIDHVAGVAEVARATGAPVHIAGDESDRLERINDFVPAGLEGVVLESYEPDVRLRGDEELELAGVRFDTLRVPGHTEAHLAYAADGCLFSGDVLFAGSVGRVDRPNGDWETLMASIRQLAERFPPETVVYPGHGPQTTLGRELDTNPFLAELRART